MRTAVGLVAAIAFGACASETEFEMLQRDYHTLKVELREWAYDPEPDNRVSVVEWQFWTGDVVCDIVARNPAAPSDPYAPNVDAYCGPIEPEEDPPAFGS